MIKSLSKYLRMNVLDGKKKKEFHGDMIRKYIEVREQVLREYFSDGFVNN